MVSSCTSCTGLFDLLFEHCNRIARCER